MDSRRRQVSFHRSFATEFREIGAGGLYVVAEAGVAHFGRDDLAEQLLELAIHGGADAFKLQVFDVDSLIASSSPEWRERLRPRTLTYDSIKRLRERCRAARLDFVLTAHDDSRIGWLEGLDVSVVKVGSGERNNPQFVSRLAALGRPVIVSTGMHRESDVRESIDACAAAGCDRLALLHCVSAYPTPPSAVNLRAMDHLKAMFVGPVGYSDHTEDGLAAVAAVALGAEIIEKHITILRDVPNAQDWKVSAGPDDFAALVADLRRTHAMLGSGVRSPAPEEADAEIWALKSLVVTRDLPLGHRLAATDLVAKRPGGGLPPSSLPNVVGRRLAHAMKADAALHQKDLDA
jgi:N,N'-diacetyllegionaminate synthase